MTDADIKSCIEAMDRRKQRGGDHKSEEAKSKASSGAIDKPTKSAEVIADALGISRSKVEKVRTIRDHGTPEAKAAVRAGQPSVRVPRL